MSRCTSGQRLSNQTADDRRASQTAADLDVEYDGAVRVAPHFDADVVDVDCRAVACRSIDRDLEFARQPVEFRMCGRPLADQFAIRTSIDRLIGRNAGELVGRDVANAVAAGLNRVHLHRCEIGEDVGHFGEVRPVELHVLPRAQVAIALVVVARDVREHAQLSRRERSVRHRDSKHRCEPLNVQTVAQTQMQKVGVRQRAVDVALRLVAKLRDAFVDKVLVKFVVPVHGGVQCAELRMGANVTKTAETIELTIVSMDRTD